MKFLAANDFRKKVFIEEQMAEGVKTDFFEEEKSRS